LTVVHFFLCADTVRARGGVGRMSMHGNARSYPVVREAERR